MNSLNTLPDDELMLLAKRAATLPDAPATLIEAAIAIGPKPSVASVVRAGMRLLAAVLKFDSWAGAPLAFGMRALPSDTRHLLFSAMGRDIDLRITPADAHFAIAGQILGPDESGRIELTPQAGPGESPRTATIDELGEFRLGAVHSGTYRLTLRMGNDEIVLPPIEVGGRYG